MNKNLQIHNKLPLRSDDERRLHPYCQECKADCEASGKDWNKVTENCQGVYTDEDFDIIAYNAELEPIDVAEILNPSEWLRINLDFEPYWYQDRIIRCTSTRKTARCGRRTGKTEILCGWILHMCCVNENYKVLSITPMKSQAKEIFDRLVDFIARNPEIEKDVRTKQQPYYEITFKNKSRIRIFVAGSGAGADAAKQVRGQEADLIFIDEMDYLNDASSAAILPVLSDPERHGEPVKFIGSSTPTGQEGLFFRLCHDSQYREFHYPSRCRPDWNQKLERESRALAKTEQNYTHEFEAEWGSKADGVFRRNLVIEAQQAYRYWNFEGDYEECKWPEMKPWPHWTYMMGVDWNGAGTGTRIIVVGYDPARERWIVTYRETIDITEFALHTAVDRIVKLNRKWRPHSIYIDAGFGQMQDELLRSIGREAEANKMLGKDYQDADINLSKQVKAIDFAETIEYEVKDPDTQELITKKMRNKNYMVENLQQHFDLKTIWISKSDADLKQQLMGYKVARKDVHGKLIYQADDELGDHDLDALLLAMFAFNKEFDNLFKKYPLESRVVVTKRPWQYNSNSEEDKPPDPVDDPAGYQEYLLIKKGLKQDKESFGINSREIKKESKISFFPTQPNNNGLSRTKIGKSNIPSRTNWFKKGNRRGL